MNLYESINIDGVAKSEEPDIGWGEVKEMTNAKSNIRDSMLTLNEEGKKLSKCSCIRCITKLVPIGEIPTAMTTRKKETIHHARRTKICALIALIVIGALAFDNIT